MGYLQNYGMSAEEYAVFKMKVRISRWQRILEEHTTRGRISWCVFDKEQFEKKLSKKIKKVYGKRVNLNNLWRDAISDLDLYVQQDFLENAYGYKFKKYGCYKDYGFALFYGKEAKSNPNCARELIEKWFSDVLLENYKKEVQYYDRFWNFSKEPFSFSQRWDPIYKAAAHFDNDFSKNDAQVYLLALSKLYGLNVKHMDDYEITFW